MQAYILQTSIMARSRPDSIKELFRAKDVTIVVENDDSKEVESLVTGDHVMLEGEKEEFYKWFALFDKVWVGYGSPMFQQFKAYDFRACAQPYKPL